MANPIFLSGETLSAAKLQQLATTSTYTPVLTASTTNPTLGSGSQAYGWHHVNGRHVWVMFLIQFGTSGVDPGSGVYNVSGPGGYSFMGGTPGSAIGICRAIDNSGGTERALALIANGNSGGAPRMFMSVIETPAAVTESNPWTWAAQDVLTGTFSYITD